MHTAIKPESAEEKHAPAGRCKLLSIAAKTMSAWRRFQYRRSARESCWYGAHLRHLRADLKKIHTGSHSAPRIFGDEMAGQVVAMGAGVKNFSVGDRVMVFHHIPCGECYYCRKKVFAQCPVYKQVGATAGFEPSGGGFAEYIRAMDWVARKGVVKIPDQVSYEQASFIEPVNTCLKAIELLQLQSDETALVIGQGPIGIILAALAKRTGATVVTSDLYPQRLKISESFGLKHNVNAGLEDPAERVRELTGGRGADAVIVATAGNSLIKPARMRPGPAEESCCLHRRSVAKYQLIRLLFAWMKRR